MARAMCGCGRAVVFGFAGLMALIAGPVVAEEPPAIDVRLTLPPIAYSVAGSECGVSFDNIVLTPHPENYRFVVTSDLGESAPRRWSVTAAETQVGDHPWKVEVFQQDRKVAQQSMTWRVVSPRAGAGRSLTLLLLGDSLTHATLYPNDLAARLSAADQPQWTMLGTHRPKSAKPGVAHEGYGGWTWERFVKHYEAMPDPAARKHSSPFVFKAGEEPPKLDVARYIDVSCGGKSPDVVLFLLGINDCFAAPPDDSAALDQHIDRVFGNAETLLKAFREAAPNADLGVCLTTPGNARESGFEANYKGKYTRWGWKRIQHRLVERELRQFGGRESERIFIVPTELNLDPTDGYPEDNGVHPNAFGYQQVAATLHAWLLSRYR